MLVQSPNASGPSSRVAALLAEEFRRLDCTVVTHSWGRSGSHEGVRARMFGTLRDVLSVHRVTRRHEVDLALVHTAHDWRTLARDVPLALALRWRKLPVVLHMHGSQPERLLAPGARAFRAATALLLRLVDAVFVLSSDEQRQWSAFSSRRPVLVIRNPYPACPRTVSPPAPSGGIPTVLFVGRLLREKGVFDLLEAMSLVARRVRCRLVLVGDGPCAPELGERVHALGLAGHVTLAGFLTGRELKRAYAEADVFVLPTYWPEGFPTVLAEAMAAALPIVTTRIRGAADHLNDGEHTLFVEPRDMEGLAVALVHLLEDRSLRRRMGEANRQRLSVFEPSLVARSYLEALESVISNQDLTTKDTRS